VGDVVRTQPAERARSDGAADPLRFRSAVPADGVALWALARDAGLDVNSTYAYVMFADYHRDTTVVAEDAGGLAGFVLGFRVPRDPDVVFVWQIAVAADRRGRGVGSSLLDELVARTGARAVEATVTPSNHASAAMFRALAARHGTTAAEETGYGEELFPDGHEAEVLFRIPTQATPTRR
jgi:L-2,4-diaminobutyric acid acetyltransferase